MGLQSRQAFQAVRLQTSLQARNGGSGQVRLRTQGRISKAGDAEVRRSLYEAASAMLTRFKGHTRLKAWGQKLAKRCHKKAVVAVARKLAVIMHAMWRDGTTYADAAIGRGGEGGHMTIRASIGGALRVA